MHYKSQRPQTLITLQSHHLDPNFVKGLVKYLSGTELINLLLTCKSWSFSIVQQVYHKPEFKSCKSFYKFVQTMKRKLLHYQYSKYVKKLLLDESVSNDLLMGDLQILLESVPNLLEFSLIGCPQGSNMLISMLSKYTPSLTYLRLEGTTVTDSLIGIVCSELTELVYLNLECSSISLNSLKSILKNSPKLKHLNLSYCGSNGDPWGKPISCILESLVLTHTEISDEGLSWISASCPFLFNLNLDGCLNLTDNGIYAISRHCKNLESLSLNFCFGITDVSLQALSIHSKKCLVNLKCHGCSITLKGIEMLNLSCRLTLEYGL